MLFDAIWNKVSEKIAGQTMHKIVLLNDDLSELQSDVDIDMLPEYLGGSKSNDVLKSISQLE